MDTLTNWVGSFLKFVAFLVIAPVAFGVWVVYCLCTGTTIIDAGTHETLVIFFKVFCAVGLLFLPIIAILLSLMRAKFSAMGALALWIGVLLTFGFGYLMQKHDHQIALETIYKTPIENAPMFKLRTEQPRSDVLQSLGIPASSCSSGLSCPFFQLVHCGDETIGGQGSVDFNHAGQLTSWSMTFDTTTGEITDGFVGTNQVRLACISGAVESHFGKMTSTKTGWAWEDGKKQVTLEKEFAGDGYSMSRPTGNFTVRYSSGFYIR